MGEENLRSNLSHLQNLLNLALLHLLPELGEDVLDLANGDEARVLLVEHLERLDEFGCLAGSDDD